MGSRSLREFVERSGFASIAAWARAACVSPQQVHQFLSDGSPVSAPVLRALADAACVSPDLVRTVLRSARDERSAA
ncbi:MAG: helix-turn-helix domain-containing protein [Polyangiaceae bacterium]